MKWYKRFGYGALGGLFPYTADFVAIGFDKLVGTLQDLSLLICAAAIIKAIPFAVVGGIWTAVNRSETDPVKLLQLGVVAPALFLAWTNGVDLNKVETQLNNITAPSAQRTAGSINSSWAQPAEQGIMKAYPAPKSRTTLEKFGDAVFGKTPKKKWFVVAGSYRNEQAARKLQGVIKSDFRQFKPVVYKPSKGNPFFKVVIGENLSFDDAVKLRNKAIKAGIPAEPSLEAVPVFR